MPSIFSNRAAFAPMFDEHVTVTGTRPNGVTIAETLAVCVLADMDDDPISDSAPKTSAQKISVFCRDKDWPAVQGKVQIGDSIAYNGTSYAVTSLSADNVIGNVIHARSIE